MKLDLSENAWRAQLAPAGAHRASVADLRVFTSTAGDQVMAELVLTLDSGHTVSELVTVWCDPSLHDFAAKCGRAKILLGQLATATGVPSARRHRRPAGGLPRQAGRGDHRPRPQERRAHRPHPRPPPRDAEGA